MHACVLFILLLLKCVPCTAQQKYDSKIIVTLADTIDIYEKTKQALINVEFIVKDTKNTDTLTTYMRPLNDIQGYMKVNAVISGTTLTLSGLYGLKKINYWGFDNIPNGINRVVYYKGSKTWKTMMEVAGRMNGDVSFSK